MLFGAQIVLLLALVGLITTVALTVDYRKKSTETPFVPTATIPAFRQIRYGPRVVFTLTTIPSRLPFLKGAILNLLEQSVYADAVYVNIPHISRREGVPYDVPDDVKQLAQLDPRVRILRCEDMGPATKLIPVLDVEIDPDTRILPADDDCRFPTHYFDELLDYSIRYPNTAFGYHGIYVSDTGNWLWAQQVFDTVDVLETVTGVIYRRAMLEGLSPPRPGPCFLTDDLTISAHVASLGYARAVLTSGPDEIATRGRKGLPMHHEFHMSNPLWKVNCGLDGAEDGNKKCLDTIKDIFQKNKFMHLQ